MKRLIAGVLLFSAACSGGADDTTTVAPATTTTEAPAPSTTTTTTTTTTTLPLDPVVTPPEEPESYRFSIRVDATISAADRTDFTISYSEIGRTTRPDRYAMVTESRIGTFPAERVEFVLIGDRSWVLEPFKPWREVDDYFLEGESTVTFLAAFEQLDRLYPILSELEWTVETRNGVTARRYAVPEDRAFEVIDVFETVDLAADPSVFFAGTAVVWLDAATNVLLGARLDYRGTQALLEDPEADLPPDAEVRFVVTLDVTDVDDPTIEIEPPALEVIDAPDGFLPYSDRAFGFSVVFPEDWSVYADSTDYGGFWVPVEFFEPETGTILDVLVEDVSFYGGGFTLDDYVDVNTSEIEIAYGEVTVVAVEPATLQDGRPARRVEYRAGSGFDEIRLLQTVAFRGSDAYILTLTTFGPQEDWRDAYDEVAASFVVTGRTTGGN